MFSRPSFSVPPSRWAFASILFCGIAAYGATLRVGFLWDDHVMIEQNHHITSLTWNSLTHAFRNDFNDGQGDPYYRPVQILLNMWDYHCWKLNPFGYHVTNLTLHLISACLLYSILGLLFEDAFIAFLAALFFVVHPIIVEQLLIIAGRGELISMTGMLASIRCTMKKDLSGYLASLFFYGIACLGKESGLIAPLLLGLIGWMNPVYRLPWRSYLSYGLMAALYVFTRKSVVGGAAVPVNWRALPLFFVQDFPTILVHYFGAILFPTDLHSHRRMLFYYPWMFLSPVLLGLIAAWGFLKKSRVLFFSSGWFLAGFLPKIPLFIGNPLILDHWGYISGIGLYTALSYAITSLRHNGSNRGKWGTTAVAAFCVLFWTGFTWSNISNRNTDKKLYEQALKYPTSSIVRCNLGLIYYQEKSFEKARKVLEESLRMNPTNTMVMNVLALTYWKLGRNGEAVNLLSKAIGLEPRNVSSYINRALVLGKGSGDKDIEQALQIDPKNVYALRLRKAYLK